jgi:hypothetical protein
VLPENTIVGDRPVKDAASGGGGIGLGVGRRFPVVGEKLVNA